jgi:O-antigen/teichoic acid export membrane protein
VSNQLENKSVRSRLGVLASGGLISLVGLAFSIILNFAYQFYLARILNPSDFGLFNLGLTVSSLFGLAIIFGLDRSIVRFIAYYLEIKDQKREIGVILSAFRLLALFSFAIIILILLAKPISIHVFRKPDLTIYLEIFFASSFFFLFVRLIMGVFQGYKNIKPLVGIENILIPILKIICTVVIVSSIGNLYFAAPISYIIALFIGFLISVLTFRKFFAGKKNIVEPIIEYHELLKFSWPLFIASMLNRTNAYIETLFLGGLSTSDQVGLYSVAWKVAISLTVFIEAVNTIFAPYITQHFTSNEMAELSTNLKFITRWALSLSLPFFLFLFLEAPAIMKFIGPEYIAGTSILRILAVAQMVYIAVGPAALILIMTKYNHLNLLDLTIAIIFSLILGFVLIPTYGAFGAAISAACTILLVNFLRLIQVYFVLGIHPYNFSYLKSIFAGIVASFVVMIFDFTLFEFSGLLSTVLNGLTLFVVYFIMIYISLNSLERKMLYDFIHQLRNFTFREV